MRLKYSCFAFILGIIVIFVIFFKFTEAVETDTCCEFLKSFGWETAKEASETREITVPKEFDEVYKNYNELQKEAGLDLLPYCGKTGTRYTYVVTNYPLDVGETVYANVICIDGKPVAGDIMTVSLSGFMHSLIYPSG